MLPRNVVIDEIELLDCLSRFTLDRVEKGYPALSARAEEQAVVSLDIVVRGLSGRHVYYCSGERLLDIDEGRSIGKLAVARAIVSENQIPGGKALGMM